MTVVDPLKVLAPLMVTVAEPVFLRLPVPEMAPERVIGLVATICEVPEAS